MSAPPVKCVRRVPKTDERDGGRPHVRAARRGESGACSRADIVRGPTEPVINDTPPPHAQRRYGTRRRVAGWVAENARGRVCVRSEQKRGVRGARRWAHWHGDPIPTPPASRPPSTQGGSVPGAHGARRPVGPDGAHNSLDLALRERSACLFAGVQRARHRVRHAPPSFLDQPSDVRDGPAPGGERQVAVGRGVASVRVWGDRKAHLGRQGAEPGGRYTADVGDCPLTWNVDSVRPSPAERERRVTKSPGASRGGGAVPVQFPTRQMVIILAARCIARGSGGADGEVRA